MLAGKSIIVTGAASGIGLASARLFAGYGAHVAMADVDPRVEALAADVPNAIGVRCDIADRAQVFALVEAAVAAFGKLDGAFHNAGVEGNGGKMTPIGEYDADEFDRVVTVNIRGLFNCLAAELARMGPGGSIVNMGSVMAWLGNPGMAGYVAAKHAVIGLTRTAALEQAAANIRVNAVLPGGVATPMLLERGFKQSPEFEEMAPLLHPLGRIADPNEIAEGAAWLLSDKASFVTGHTLAIDGGFSAR